jgi:hypothetical protein
MAKTASEQKPSSEFHVVLTGLKLAADVERRIEGQIRQIVMQELAQLDLGDDFTVAARSKFAKTRAFGGGTMGFRADF